MARIVNAGLHPLADGVPPDWASCWGQDRFGVYLGFSIGTVTQRLRWVPPGSFWMGSPEDEPGRDEDEGPRHMVTLTAGFWLFETPCTQALWEAVMGDNPSRFPSPTRPVETVGFEDVQAFMAKLNDRVPGLNLVLPSEAQWEYACRARTETATYAGPMDILGRNNAPILDPIAWYGGNSGVNFDLAEGHGSRDWPEKQYPHERAGTRTVGQKTPNRFGLFDMLGNVFEYCEDHWHDSYDGAPEDGSAWIDRAHFPDGAALRVMRGGAWDVSAHSVRSAYRIVLVPTIRSGIVGFRCARVQSERGTYAERAERAGVVVSSVEQAP